jgi:ADP-heptose:LPS heptosyltransferase
MGDVVRTLPAVAALRARYPQAEITWLVERKAEGVIREQPELDHVLVFPREELEAHWRARRWGPLLGEASRFARVLRRRRFDLVIDFHAILKSGILARLTGAPLRVGYAPPFSREASSWFANRRARLEPARISRFERNAALVDFLGGEAPPPAGRAPGFRVDPERRLRMRARLGVPGPVALIHPGTSAATPYKRYPVERWAAVARALRVDGVHCVVSTGGAAETEVARALVASSDAAAALAPPTPAPGDLAALAAACDVFLGSDSGPLHLASLVGTPVVQVLGPTDPVENRPWEGTPFRSLRVPVGCSPCRRGCAAAACMSVVPPASVVRAARELLALADAGRQRA